MRASYSRSRERVQRKPPSFATGSRAGGRKPRPPLYRRSIMCRARFALFFVLSLAHASVPPPADWVPARWPWTEPRSLDLLTGSPVNCVLLKTYDADFANAAAARSIVTLAVVTPAADPIAAAKSAIAAHFNGIVLEGNFPEGTAAKVRDATGGAPVVELTARSRVLLAADAAIIGTYQGVWPGIAE